MAEPFISQISAFGLNFTIRNWTQCMGQMLAISQNQALFSLIADIYGGDGRSSMGVPDLKGRGVLHSGRGPGLSQRPIGSINTQRQHSLDILNLPSHTHQISQKARADTATILNPTSATITAIPEGSFQGIPISADWYTNQPATVDLSSEGSPSTTASGNSSPTSILSPYQVVTYEMALLGDYPPRS